MGRPRKHQEATADALVAAAEQIVESEGLDALTVRRVAETVETTTRAVYTVYGSKEALLVALGIRAFDLLRTELEKQPTTSDPAADLVDAGVEVFRRFAVEHPALFGIGFRRTFSEPSVAAGFRDAAADALVGLHARVERLESTGQLGDFTVADASRAYHALCEGLAAMELGSLLPDGDEPRFWRSALTALVRGFATS